MLEVEGLTKRFGGVVASRDVSFRVAEGEIHGLIGPNGAGKSSVFKMIVGQLRPTSGCIRYRGIDIAGLPIHRIARLGIGVKTQVPNLFGALTVEENIWVGARRRVRRTEAARVIAEIAGRVGIAEELKHVAAKMAHGRRQLLELAVVLAAGPDLILLDEPAAGLSDAEVDHLIGLLREINRTKTLIIVEHDMRFIRAIASTITVLHQGSVYLEGDAATVLSDEGLQDIYLGRGGGNG